MSSDVRASPTLEVGRVARAHGVRGELKVSLHWADSDALLQVQTVILVAADGERRTAEVESARSANRSVLLKLSGVDDKDAADALRGAGIHVLRDELPAPAPGEYYLSDLVGATVLAPDGEIGQVVEVRTHPSIDAIVIRTPAGKLVEQPLAEHWLEAVDLDARCVRLSSSDGLIE
jgi:16S rRNA processing protein RimM